MNRFESVTKPLLWFMTLLLVALTTGCGKGGDAILGETGISSSAKVISAYSLNGVSGTINEAAKTIAVTVPFGTNVTALVASFTTTGARIKVGATVQTNASTANDFTNPVAYTVTAANGTTAIYTVTVTLAAIDAKAITAYSFAEYAGVIDEATKTIAVTVPSGTDVTALVATFSTTGKSVKIGTTVQISRVTANDFTNSVAYIVTAADNLTATYTVTVTVASVTAKAMTAYSFAGYTGAAGTIDEAAKTIAVTVPSGTAVTALVATFTATGTSVKVGTTVQTSVATANDFTNPVAYIVTAADGSSATYTVTVTAASASSKAMTVYSFAGYAGAGGVINEADKTISVTVPNGTAVTALVATFSSTGASVKVGTAVQTSVATANNFTNPVSYTVTAADNTTAIYTVTVTVASATAKAMTAYSFAGYAGATGTINETAKTIAVTLPNGTDVTALVATFTSTGTSVKVGTAVQTSVASANNFTSPVDYIVAAADLSTATYRVTVTVAATSAKAITAYSLGGAVGAINEVAKTIAVTVPNGTAVSGLIATFTTTGTSVKVGTVVQTSTVTANNFSSPVTYIVAAADASTVNYTVTVTVAAPVALAVNLGGVASFGIASRAGLTSTGVTVVNGDVALYPTATCTDATGNSGASQTCLVKTYSSTTGMTVNGSIYWAGDPFDSGVTANSVTNDLNVAWTEARAKVDTQGAIAADEIGGKTFIPGVYHNAALGLAAGGVATLDAQNDANAIFVFKVDSSFVDSGTLLLPSRINLINSAQARNVWFVTGLDITIGSGTIWNGNILAGRTATILDGSTVNGRVLAGATGAGAITLTGAASPSVTTITVPK